MNLLNFTGLIVIPLVSSPVVYLAGRLGTHETTLHGRSYLVRVLAFLAVLAAWVPFIVSVQTLFLSGTQEFNVNTIWLRVDGISLFMAGCVLLLGTLVILFSGSYMAGEVGEEKYYAMLLAMMGLMIGLVSASDLFNLWVWFEAMAISSYLLVAFYREQPASLEAGMKYLVQSATGSVLVLIGIAIVLAQAGTLDMAEIAKAVAGAGVNRFALLGAGALFVIGFGVKVALVPLHTWLPDAHSQAPSGISAMLSGVVIEIGLIAMLRALAVLTGFALSWGILLMAFGALNILYGNLLALRQTLVKRLLAYSSLSHIGYILLGLGIALYSGIELGAQGAFFHLFNHMLMKGLAFLAVGALMYGMFLQNGSHRSLKIERPGRSRTKVSARCAGIQHRRAGARRDAAAGWLYVEVADLCRRVSNAKYLDHRLDDLHGAQQRAFAWILCAAGQPDVSQGTLATGAGRKTDHMDDCLAVDRDDLAGDRAWLLPGADGLVHRPRG